MSVRSLLFVPGDRPERFSKAVVSEADAIILDLEDSVDVSRKEVARESVAAFLSQSQDKPILVRCNPLGSEYIDDDFETILKHRPDGCVLPKCESAADIEQLVLLMGEQPVPILPIATETPASVFGLGTYRDVEKFLFGLTWGAEDLPSAIGAISSRQEDGSFTAPYEWVRTQALFAAHAANVSAIETVYPRIKDLEGLKAYTTRGRRDGFTAMMALHPAQCPIINSAFTPSEAEIIHARKIISAFANAPDAGVLSIDGEMVDRPHLVQAQKIIERTKPQRKQAP